MDLTTLEKVGNFPHLKNLVRVYHHKKGLHIVVMYLVIGNWRFPWSFRVYRGKGTSSPSQLAQKLLTNLPKILLQSLIKTRGQQVYLNGLDLPVFLSWVWLKRDGKRVQRFVISTKPMKGRTQRIRADRRLRRLAMLRIARSMGQKKMAN
ncbi:MAG: hypothetical protein AAGE96_08955 [Cyanobacteria bacterium P01_G01_bin.19]